MVHGELWTIKELFVLPNEYIYWSIQIVMYPLMTGLVAPAFFLSSLYLLFFIHPVLTLGSFDISETAQRRDRKAIKILAGAGIPVACFLHGYAGFIFGSVKANALWMTPLMPVIFIMS